MSLSTPLCNIYRYLSNIVRRQNFTLQTYLIFTPATGLGKEQKLNEKEAGLRQWLWLSLQSSRFRQQRSAVRIQSSANIYIRHFLFIVSCIEKTKIKRKRGREWPICRPPLRAFEVESNFHWPDNFVAPRQCDQIGRFFALWSTIQNSWQQLFYPNCLHCQAILVKVSKSIFLLV